MQCFEHNTKTAPEVDCKTAIVEELSNTMLQHAYRTVTTGLQLHHTGLTTPLLPPPKAARSSKQVVQQMGTSNSNNDDLG